MKKTIKLLGIFTMVTVFGFAMIACDSGGGTTTYTVTVIGGTGSGDYAPGATVYITATVPSGQQFLNWTVTSGGVTLNNANSSNTYFIMPENAVTVTASTSGGGNPPDDTDSAEYIGTANGTTYTLKITKGTNPVTPPGETNPFIGTWNGMSVDNIALTVIFSESGWDHFLDADPSDVDSGTYTYSGNTATMVYEGIITVIATISGSTLTVTSQYPEDIHTPWTLTKSSSRSVSYVDSARALFTPSAGDDYELTVGAKTSSGKVQTAAGNNLTLKPSVSVEPFYATTTTSGNGLTNVSGLITFDDGDTAQGPGTVTPGNSPGPDAEWTARGDWTAIKIADGPFDTGNIIDAIVAMAFGDNTFVAGTEGGRMAYSSDGITWTAVTNNPFSPFVSQHIYDIAYGNGIFVAFAGNLVDGSKMSTSTDGKSWTAAVDTSDFLVDLAFVNGIFIAGGRYGIFDKGVMATSTDGITWTNITSHPFTYRIRAFAYGNGTFVAGGYNGEMATSPDGITWTAVANSPFTRDIFAIAYGNGTFVAGDEIGNMSTSTDGNNWTAVTDGIFSTTMYWLGSIAFGSGTFVAVNGRDVATSSDGKNWTTVDIGAITIEAVVFGKDTFVVGGSSFQCRMAYWKP